MKSLTALVVAESKISKKTNTMIAERGGDCGRDAGSQSATTEKRQERGV